MKRTMILDLFGEQMFSDDSHDSGTDFPTGEDPAVLSSSETDTEQTAFSDEASADPSEKNTECEPPLSEDAIRRIYGHIARLEEESRELREIFPGFDLYRELKNPVFARLTAPENGISAADAYYAIHRKEIQSMRPDTRKMLPDHPGEPVRRPHENGISAKAPAVMNFDYRMASREQREALKKAIRAAAAKGEKLYP